MSEITHDLYRYSTDAPWSNGYLWEPVREILEQNSHLEPRVFEIGCGNGATANTLASSGYRVTGIDSSKSGIEIANRAYPGVDFFLGDAYDDLAAEYGTFPIVICLEVIEHCFYPRKLADNLFHLLDDDGVGIISTPFHGYMKNVALAISNKMDRHYTALWDGGHIKFFSVKTMRELLKETGFQSIRFLRVGRVAPLAKSMIAVVHK